MSLEPDGQAKRARSLSQLLRAAAVANPGAIFARVGGLATEAPAALRVRAIDALADHYAVRLAETGLTAGARLLLLATPEPRALAAIVGGLRAGLDVVLAPPALDAAALAAAACACGADALVGPSQFAELETAERLLEAGALMDSVKLVALWGAGAKAAVGLDDPLEGGARDMAPQDEPQLLAVAMVGADAKCEPISQQRAHGIASEFVSRSKLAAGEAIVSTISFASAAGLVAGAFAPLLGRAHVVWQAPFAAQRFLEVLQTSAPAHLFAPIAVARELGEAGALGAGRLSSLALVAHDDAPIPDFELGVDPARAFVLRSGARLEGVEISGWSEKGRAQ